MSWKKTIKQGLEVKIKKISTMKKVHDELVRQTEERCHDLGCDDVQTYRKFSFSKLARPKEVKSGHGEIDVYAVHKSKRVLIFEIKGNYRRVSTNRQLMRAEAYLYHLYPQHRFYLFCVTPKKIKGMTHEPFTWPWDPKYNDEKADAKRYSQQKGKERKERETSKNYKHYKINGQTF